MSLDEFIGVRLRELRTKEAQSPEKVAAYLSVPLDVYAAFELGRRPVTAGHLYDLCILFNVKVTYFFEGYERGHDRPYDEDKDSCGGNNTGKSG